MNLTPPHATKEEVQTALRAYLNRTNEPFEVDFSSIQGIDTPVVVGGIRGYYRDSVGRVGFNEFGEWDDALFFFSRDEFQIIRGNTDPVRMGWNAGVGKPFAVLQPGISWMRRGPHRGRKPALRQCTDEEADGLGIPDEGEFTVQRSWGENDRRNYFEKGYFAINVHDSLSEGTTSSWGCQTAPHSTFIPWMIRIWELTTAAKQSAIPYILINGPIK